MPNVRCLQPSAGTAPQKRAARSAFVRRPVRHIVLDPRLPPVSVADLALMLEIDLLLSRRKDFIGRLQRALNAAASLDSLTPGSTLRS